MTLAAANDTTRPRRIPLRRTERLALSLDAFLMAGSLAVCGMLLGQGGLEAALFALAGALIAARKAPAGARLVHAYSGGFAGLFIGALFAAFFHDALVRLVQLL